MIETNSPEAAQQSLIDVSHLNGTANGSVSDFSIESTKQSKDSMDQQAMQFLGKSFVVRLCFARWRARKTQVDEWKEACRRSESYKHRQQESNPSASSSRFSTPMSKRRRESVGPSPEPSRIRRRLKKSGLSSVEPRTDEQLAQRLREVRKFVYHFRFWGFKRQSILFPRTKRRTKRDGYEEHLWMPYDVASQAKKAAHQIHGQFGCP